MVKERWAGAIERRTVDGRTVGAAKTLRVVAGRRRREAKSLEAIVAGGGWWEGGAMGSGAIGVGSGVLKVEVQSSGGLCAKIVRRWSKIQGV